MSSSHSSLFFKCCISSRVFFTLSLIGTSYTTKKKTKKTKKKKKKKKKKQKKKQKQKKTSILCRFFFLALFVPKTTIFSSCFPIHTTLLA
jgi:flagellar biosynthesis component FlhA